MKTKRISISVFQIVVFFIILILIINIVPIVIKKINGKEENVKIQCSFEGEGTKEKPYLIQKEEELIELANLVNDGYTFSESYFVLTTKLNFLDINAITIGNSTNTAFDGIFDGNEKTIENLNFNISEQPNTTLYGLFGNNKGTIKNLKVTGNINADDIEANDIYIGLVCAKNEGTIDACKVEGKINVNLQNNGTNGIIAGITAENSGNISNSTSNVEIISNQTKAGICGINNKIDNIEKSGEITNCTNSGNIQENEATSVYSAGIVAKNYKGTITSCTNSGKLIGKQVAGIAAYSNGDIISCQNIGSISNIEGTISGGIVGVFEQATMENCRNTGEVSGTMDIGGIVAQNNGKISQTRNEGTVSKTGDNTSNIVCIAGIAGKNFTDAKILNSKNSGTITASENNKIYIGGICGILYNNSIVESCENSGILNSKGKYIETNDDLTQNCKECTNTGTGSVNNSNIGEVYIGLIYGKLE